MKKRTILCLIVVAVISVYSAWGIGNNMKWYFDISRGGGNAEAEFVCEVSEYDFNSANFYSAYKESGFLASGNYRSRPKLSKSDTFLIESALGEYDLRSGEIYLILGMYNTITTNDTFAVMVQINSVNMDGSYTYSWKDAITIYKLH